jgi:hypothetical protein
MQTGKPALNAIIFRKVSTSTVILRAQAHAEAVDRCSKPAGDEPGLFTVCFLSVSCED